MPSKDPMYDQDRAWIFQQDCATCHTAKSVKKWFEEEDITVLPWPAKSPDLNPIENIWSWIDRRLEACKMTNVDELKTEIHRIWQEIPKEMCMRLVESMPKRVRACYLARGGHFKY